MLDNTRDSDLQLPLLSFELIDNNLASISVTSSTSAFIMSVGMPRNRLARKRLSMERGYDSEMEHTVTR